MICFSNKLVGTPNFEQVFERFFISICNITIVLENLRISLNRDFDNEVLLRMCAETINYCVKLSTKRNFI